MSIRDLKGKVKDLIPVENVLVSVFDKKGLEQLIPGLIGINPKVRFLSTGGTFTKIKEILGVDSKTNLMEIAEYTGFPEMEGGLVKTLHPKIHAGILAERNNPEHQRYLQEMNGAYIDMVIANLYPFEDVIRQGVSFEKARGNIDIGGPTMLRAAAKNFPSCAAVCDPKDYPEILTELTNKNGSTSFILRAILARGIFYTTASYDRTIRDCLRDQNLIKVKELYDFE